MEHLWTWGGKYFGYRRDNELWTYKGKHIGNFIGDENFNRDGRYLGEIRNDSYLIICESKKNKRGISFTPHGKRGAIGKMGNYGSHGSLGGYHDFPEPEEFTA